MREIDIEGLAAGKPYRLMTGLVIPRPIAWVSTVDGQGRPNLAPHSFFTVASADPPIVQFTSVGRKDSLTNAEETGEFVVNLASRPHLDAMNQTSAPLPRGESEFAHAGLEQAPSVRVRPPRVAGAPAALECVLERVIEVGDCFLVLGRVVHAAVAEDALDGERPNEAVLDPVARLSGSRYTSYGETLSVKRPG